MTFCEVLVWFVAHRQLIPSEYLYLREILVLGAEAMTTETPT